jgi:hypothetical protein
MEEVGKIFLKKMSETYHVSLTSKFNETSSCRTVALRKIMLNDQRATSPLIEKNMIVLVVLEKLHQILKGA